MLNRKKDRFLQTITYMASFTSLFVLISILSYILLNGFHLLNWDLITHDFESVSYIADLKTGYTVGSYPTNQTFKDNVYYSEKWGIALMDETNLLGKNVVLIYYIDDNSPLKLLNNKGVSSMDLVLKPDYEIIRIAFDDGPSALEIQGAENMINVLETKTTFREFEFATSGGGIRGSIITTFYLIILTLLMALPIGVGAAIYLNEYASKNSFTKIIRVMIETLTGVPSIIYGLMGLAIFVPFTMRITSATGGNILAGSMTLAVILLPIIIRTTEESLKVVPDDLRNASLSLGATKSQTIFKVILPNAFSGILTATLLAIGRIIGESAALIFAIGTTIKDNVSITEKSTSLAVHIWAMMTDEPANIELSTTIAIIILVIVLSLNLTVKGLSKRFMRKYGIEQ